MRALAVLSCAAACLAAPAGPVSASAPSDVEQPCSATAAPDPNPEAPDHTETWTLEGGPIAQNGTLTCTILVGGGLHAYADSGAKASATGTNGVTVLAPTPVTYTSPPNSNVYICDEFTDAAGVTYVYDDLDGAWEPAAGNTTAGCRYWIWNRLRDDPFIQGDPPLADIDCLILSLLVPVDVAGVVAIRRDGDIEVAGDDLWICPPYDS